jgi:nicotinate-nucleotide pyrophosphorylase
MAEITNKYVKMQMVVAAAPSINKQILCTRKTIPLQAKSDQYRKPLNPSFR